uniref:Uncharacterized protein n=1 Tax=Knipowitschia caucasica TaxID=637954 RepID=A0AAV2JJS2_KNICA
MESSVDEEEEQEEDLDRFRELKLQIDVMEKAEREAEAKPTRLRPLPALRRKKAPRTIAAPLQVRAPPWNSPEERRQEALRELREKEAVLEQRRKNQEELHNWRTRAKNPQLTGPRGKRPGRQRHAEEAAGNSSDAGPHQAHSSVDYEESRAVKKLQQKMYAVVQRMEERRRDPAASSQELFGPADRDVKEIRRLQAQLLDVKRGRGFALYSAHARQKKT